MVSIPRPTRPKVKVPRGKKPRKGSVYRSKGVKTAKTRTVVSGS